MITCHVTSKIDPAQIENFEACAKAWISLVELFGGTHHGYFLPHEGPNDLALRHFHSHLGLLTKPIGQKAQPIQTASRHMILP